MGRERQNPESQKDTIYTGKCVCSARAKLPKSLAAHYDSTALTN